MFIPSHTVEQWIEEDVPGLDLTSHLLGMEAVPAEIHFKARHETVLSGSEEAAAVFERLGAKVTFIQPGGTRVSQGDPILTAHGDGEAMHAGWRIALNLLEYSSGIATRTAKLVEAAQQGGDVLVCGTRKSFPGTRRLSQRALMAGGGVPHRMGLGETILVFSHHYRLIGYEAFLQRIPELKSKAREKKIGVEVDNPDQAVAVARAGADMLQLDKCPPDRIVQVVRAVRQHCPDIIIAAAGGVNGDNAATYARTGVDMLVTSWMYFGKPADISAVISKP